MFKTKEQVKTPEDELNEAEKVSSTQQRVQGNDCKDVQRTWEKNEQSRRFLTKVGKYKDKSEVKNTITEINSRLDKRQEQDQ